MQGVSGESCQVLLIPQEPAFSFAHTGASFKFAAIKEQIEAVRKCETEYIPPKARPCPEPPANSVKLTTSAMLREHALYQKQLNEERQRLHAFEVALRDDSDFKSWQEEMRSRDQIMETVQRRFTKAAVDACDQAAVDARNAKVQENREVVKKVKEESQKLEALKEEFFVNLELFNRLRRENIIEGQKSVKNLERESAQIMKKFDRDSTADHGLLAEMSISELQERLALVKQAIKKEEEYRRVRINASKDENHNKIAEKSAFVQKMRQLARVQRLAKKDERALSRAPGSEVP